MKSPNETESRLATLTATVTKHRAAADKAAAALKTAEDKVAAAQAAHLAAPSDATRKALAAARVGLERALAESKAAAELHSAAHREEEDAHAYHLRAKQNAFADQLRLEKSIAKRPEVAGIVEEARAKGIALDALRGLLAERELELEQARDKIAALETQLASALAPKRA